MNRQYRKFWSLMLIASLLAPGCAPQQPFYCHEDGDLSHYLGVATNIEYPESKDSPTCEVTNTLPPLTLKNTDNYQIWDLSLNEAVQITLCTQPGDATTRWPRRFHGSQQYLANNHQSVLRDDHV